MATVQDVVEQVSQAVSMHRISESAAAKIRQWLTEAPFEEYRARLIEDIEAGRWRELDNAFYAVMPFGTGGRRGRMYPVGTNVLNDRTIAESARGLADFVSSHKTADEGRSCVVAHDARHHSREFAECCARVLAAAGFRVYLFPEPRSTPLLSFAVRHLVCDAGIMITASHNPPSDNGFKCYAKTGGQVIPPDDAGIIACVNAVSDREIPETSIQDGLADGSIVRVGPEVDEAFIAAVVSQSVASARDLKIVYSPMHGTGESACAAAMIADGFSQLNVLASQRVPDGDFPTVPGHVANPEVPRTLDAAIAEARSTGADLVIASDPDADRIGVAVPSAGDPSGDWTTLTGNQIGAMLTAFVIDQTRKAGALRPEHYIVTTLVSTPMGRALADRAGVRTEDDLLVGFKWIAHRIDEAGPSNFLFGFEESHGYLKGTHVRDKDAAVAALLFAELAATCKAEGRSVLAYLDDLYRQVGHYSERLINKVFEGRQGAGVIEELMRSFREEPPRQIASLDVAEIYDYKTHEIRRPGSSAPPTPLPRPSGDLLIFQLGEPGTRFAARPSGTEPKIKFYLFARTDTADLPERSSIEEVKARTLAKLDRMTEDIDRYIEAVVSRLSAP